MFATSFVDLSVLGGGRRLRAAEDAGHRGGVPVEEGLPRRGHGALKNKNDASAQAPGAKNI